MTTQLKLRPEFKARWVEALRSGLYEQGKDRLRSPLPGGGYAYCCLGVACDLVDPEGWEWCRYENWVHRGMSGLPAPEIFHKMVAREDTDLSELAITINGVERGLDRHNDLGATFAEIAKAIEEQL